MVLNYKTKIECVLFDLDDTLLDTYTQIQRAYHNAFDYLMPDEKAKLALLWNRDEPYLPLLRTIGSIHPRNTLKALLYEIGYSLSDYEQRLTSAEEIFHQTMLDITPFSGIIEMLTELQDRQIPIGIISDGPSERQWQKIDKTSLTKFFDNNIWISGDYPHNSEKPAPIMFKAALKHISSPAANVMYAGDRDKDQIGANLAGMISTRVLQGYFSFEPYKPQFAISTPDYVIEDTKDILKIIDGEIKPYAISR